MTEADQKREVETDHEGNVLREDDVLRRMLATKPKPRSDSKLGKRKSE